MSQTTPEMKERIAELNRDVAESKQYIKKCADRKRQLDVANTEVATEFYYPNIDILQRKECNSRGRKK